MTRQKITLKCNFNLQKVVNYATITLKYFKNNFQNSKTYNFKI